jgi:hypothetical protein
MKYNKTELLSFEEFSEIYRNSDKELYDIFCKKTHKILEEEIFEEVFIKSFVPWNSHTDEAGNIHVSFEGETVKISEKGKIGGELVFLKNLNCFRGHLYYRDREIEQKIKPDADINKPINKIKVAELIELKEYFKNKRTKIFDDKPDYCYTHISRKFFDILRQTGLIKYNDRFEHPSIDSIETMSRTENIKNADLETISEIVSAWWIIYDGYALSLLDYLMSGRFENLLYRLEELFDEIK